MAALDRKVTAPTGVSGLKRWRSQDGEQIQEEFLR